MTTTKELNTARKSLVNSLGENAKTYFEKMKLWFQMKSTKEEFDGEVRAIMNDEQVHLHNEFLLCLFNKVRGLVDSNPVRPNKLNNAHNMPQNFKEKRLRLKRKYKTDKSNFEPADMYAEVICQTSSPVRDEPIGANRSSAQELVLPDRTFVQARLMLAAWENNMDGAEENTAHIIIAAMQIFLKNILTAIFTRRKGFAIRDGSFIYDIGEPVPNSWRKNTAKYHTLFKKGPTEVWDPDGQVPTVKPTVFDAEQARAFSIACSEQVVRPTPPPVKITDLLRTLKSYRNLVNNHTIYATNMERLFTYSTHPTWEDLETRQIICQK